MPDRARGEPRLNVVVLSGGVGGARFVVGVVDVAGAAATTVIGYVGDDVEVLGLHVSPDLDSILYALAGHFPFQEWFVARGHRDEVDAVRFEGEEAALPAPGVLEALAGADLILLAPSNPYVSVGPILAVLEVREALRRRRVACVAVSP